MQGSSTRSAVVLLLLVLVAGSAWWFGSRHRGVEVGKTSAPRVEPVPSPAQPIPDLPPSVVPPSPDVVIDPALAELADSLHDSQTTPEDDLRIVEEFLQTYGKAKGGHPIGENADITAALTGANGHQGRVFPPAHRTIREGQLMDRWGSPFWFHANSGQRMEIRSAGPDRQLFTADDIVRNPSPEGLGVSPPGGAAP